MVFILLVQYYSVSKSFLLPHTYGVDNDDILNPLATIPASVVVFPVTVLTAILIPPHDEVCLTLPIPNDLLVFFEVRLNAFV